MPDYYYQIKGKKGEEDFSLSNWIFPPIFSGKVTADNKKLAKDLIEIEYDKKFPLRVLQKDLETNEFLLSIEEIKPGSHIERLFQLQNCNFCGSGFFVIDKYNDQHCIHKGFVYCSDKCKDEYNAIDAFKRNENEVLNGKCVPVIYKITNINTGKHYIGKTTQVFTLRWYQHFFQSGNCKFHEAIKTSKLTDWIFQIQEILVIPNDMLTLNDVEAFISERERFWMNEFNSINEGYNSKL